MMGQMKRLCAACAAGIKNEFGGLVAGKALYLTMFFIHFMAADAIFMLNGGCLVGRVFACLLLAGYDAFLLVLLIKKQSLRNMPAFLAVTEVLAGVAFAYGVAVLFIDFLVLA